LKQEPLDLKPALPMCILKQKSSDYKPISSVGSSIDGLLDGTIDQRATDECFCSIPAFTREV